MIIAGTAVSRETIDLDGDTAVEAIDRVLAGRGYRIVRSGCPIDDHLAVRDDSRWQRWRSDQLQVLANALGAKVGIVDSASAWAPTVQALNADRDRLAVAVPDIAGHSLYSTPATLEVITVEVAGELISFDSGRPAAPSQWEQLREFLGWQVAHAVQRGEQLYVAPIQWDRVDQPMITVSAEPGPDIDEGHGFYVEQSPAPDDDELAEPEPVAPYERSGLPAVIDAMCEIIDSWAVSPSDITTLCFGHRRMASFLPG